MGRGGAGTERDGTGRGGTGGVCRGVEIAPAVKRLCRVAMAPARVAMRERGHEVKHTNDNRIRAGPGMGDHPYIRCWRRRPLQR